MRRATGNTAVTLQGGLPEQGRAAHLTAAGGGPGGAPWCTASSAARCSAESGPPRRRAARPATPRRAPPLRYAWIAYAAARPPVAAWAPAGAAPHKQELPRHAPRPGG